MARRIKQLKKQPVVVDDHKVRFLDLPVCKRMLTLRADYTKTPVDFGFGPGRGEARVQSQIKGAIVKPVIRYHEGDDVRADVAGLLKILEVHASHVRPPEYEVVRKRRRRVEDGFGKGVTMLQATEAYMDARPPKVARNDVVARLGQLFEQVEEKDKADLTRINPFTIRRVIVEGFMPFKDRQEVVFDDGVYGVVGLNRAGKSSLLDAIEFALTGKTGRKPRSNDKFIHDQAESASVQLDLDFSGEPFSIVRRIDKNGSTSADVTGCKGGKVSEADDAILKKVGVSTQDLLWTCIVRQRELGGLLGQTSAPMQDALFRWLGIDAWAKAEKLAEEQVRLSERKVSGLALEMTSLEQRLGVKPPEDDEVEAAKKDLKAAEDVGSSLVDAEKDLKRAEQRLDLFDVALLLPDRIDALESAETHTEQINGELATRTAELQRVEKELTEAQSMARDGFDGTCPVDSGDCPRTVEINKDVAKFKCAVREATEARKAARKLVDELKSDVYRVRKEHDDARDNHAKSKQAAESFETGTKRNDLVAVVKAADKVLRSLEENDPGDAGVARERYVGMLAKQAVYAENVKRVGEITGQIDAARADFALARYVKLLCSRQGVPSMIVEGAIGVVEQAANDTLERLGTPHRLEFSFETEIKKPATTCRACGAEFPKTAKIKKCEQCDEPRGNEVKHELTPWIVEGGSSHDFAMDSGGGQDLVALAVRVALSRFMGAVLLIVDEACANLDAVNVAAFTKMVARLGDVGFRQVFMSSHRAEVKESTERLIVVEREGGASRIVVEG